MANDYNERWEFETHFHQKGLIYVAGIDEAGRGPLAGPVVAAAVILKEPIPGIDDSKRLSEKERTTLDRVIKEQALAWAIASASHEEIDDINILQATFLAMNRAWQQLKIRPQALLVDGNRFKGDFSPVECIVKGDQRSLSIGAASILAKVERDRLLHEYGITFPGYGFERHKGYPTIAHYEAIERLGLTPIHRKSFFKRRKV